MRELGANADVCRTADAWDIERCLDMIASCGFAGVLLYADEGRAFLEANMTRITEALRGRDLSLMQLHAEWPSVIDADDKLRASALDEHARWAALAAAMKAQTLIVHPTGTAASGRYLEGDRAWEVLVESCRRLAAGLDGSPVTLAVENDTPRPDEPERPTVGGSVADLLDLCAAAGRDNVGICLDVSHCWANGEDPADAAARAGNAVVTTHIHDTRGNYDEHLPPGQGKTDWTRFLAALDAKVPLVLEVQPVTLPRDAERALDASKSYLLSAMGITRHDPDPPRQEADRRPTT